MKTLRFLVVIATMALTQSAVAQDIIITQEGDAHKVYELEIGASSVFYKAENSENAALQKMDKANILMIKYQDGRKVIMGQEENTAPTVQASPVQPTTTQDNDKPAELSPELKQQNLEWIREYNKKNTFSNVEPQKDKQANRLLCTLGFKESSTVFTNDIKVEFEIGYFDPIRNSFKDIETEVTHERGGFLYEFLIDLNIILNNTSTRTIYVDLGNSFFTRNGKANTMYTPTATTTSSSTSQGVGVNLGAVANAMGVGGAVGTLAQGVNVGGGTTAGTSSTTYSQRIIAIPPKSSKIINTSRLFEEVKTNSIHFMYREHGLNYELFSKKNIKRNEKILFGEEDSPLQFITHITYSYNEDCAHVQTLNTELYLKDILGCYAPKTWDTFNFEQKYVTPNFNKNSLILISNNDKE